MLSDVIDAGWTSTSGRSSRNRRRAHRPALAAVAVAEARSVSAERQLLGGLLEAVDGGEHGAGVAEQALAGGVSVTLRLERSNSASPSSASSSRMRCDSGGADMQAGRGSPEVALLGDRDEVAQPAQVDVRHAGTVARSMPRLSSAVLSIAT